MEFKVHLGPRTRNRKRSDGSYLPVERYYLDYKDPADGSRRQPSFRTKKEAEAAKNKLIAEVATNTYVNRRTEPTISEVLDLWLANKEGKVKPQTVAAYAIICQRIRGPLLVGTGRERAIHTEHGIAPKNARFLPMLGKMKLSELRTADIRLMYRQLTEHSGAFTARRALSVLRSVLAFGEEDYGIRAASMPTQLGRGRQRAKKAILTPEHIAIIIEAAKADPEHGLYYAFPFLAGTRPSEQLGLLWDDIDFERNVIRIRRIQERDGSLTEMTKTIAGTREIPMTATLRAMLMEWRLRCPRLKTQLHRVFPGPGRPQAWPLPRLGGGGPLTYPNFRNRYWIPLFKRLGLPYVSPHSARHSFISTLQMKGIEVGLVAKIAGHANPTVTLSHYTQSVRNIDVAAQALEQAYAAG